LQAYLSTPIHLHDSEKCYCFALQSANGLPLSPGRDDCLNKIKNVKKTNTPFASVTRPYYAWSDEKLLTDTTKIKTAMTDNPDFPNPTPSIADYSAAVAEFMDLLGKAGSRDTNAIIAKNMSRDALIDLSITLGSYAELASNGVREVLLSTNLPIRKLSQPIVLGKPSNFRCTNGINPGELQLKIDTMDGVVSFNFMYTKYPIAEGAAWETVSSSKSTCLITNLEAGTRYAFRVAAIGTNEQRVWGETLQSPFVQ
jgi:hypothetical protein